MMGSSIMYNYKNAFADCYQRGRFSFGVYMPVYKVNKDENFTVVSNTHLRDQRLTLKAKGLMTMVLSLSPDWNYSISGLAAICKEGKSAVKSALKELKDCGYLTVTKIPPKEGNATFDYLYEFYEKPLHTNSLGIENLPLENLALENRTQLNKDELNTDGSKVKNNIQGKEGKQRLCPECKVKMFRNTQTGWYECPQCFFIDKENWKK